MFREGEYGTSFYLIESGTAVAFLHYGEENQRRLSEMKTGQYFGEMAVIEAWPRSATVVAEGELQVTEIPEAGLNQYFKEAPERILAIMKQLSARIRTLTEEYDEVTAFLQDRQTGEAQKKSGFTDRLKKYLEASRVFGKYFGTTDRDAVVSSAGSLDNSPLPIRVCHRGQLIFREGDEARTMFAVHGGAVGIYTNYGTALEKKLTTLYANSFFGEMGMIDQEPRSATAVVEEDSTILESIGPEDLQKLFEVNPLEVDMMMRHLSGRLRRLTLDYARACGEAAGA